MSSQPGRPPVSTSFKKGNTASLGNDKTLNFATALNKVLAKQLKEIDTTTLEGYEQMMQVRDMLATKLVKKAVKAKDDMVFKGLFAEIADRTDGKPKQSVDLSSEDGSMSPLSEEQVDAIIEKYKDGS